MAEGTAEAAAAPGGRFPHARLGLAVAAVLFVVDQATKLAVLYGLDLAARGPVEVLPVLDLVLVWNPGISYGLFPQETVAGRLLLVGFTVAASLAIGVWMVRARHRLTALSLALVLGGALGNLVDRVVYGAVVDFVHFHVGTFSWYVFNVADAAIVLGVLALLLDAFLGRDQAARGAAGG